MRWILTGLAFASLSVPGLLSAAAPRPLMLGPSHPGVHAGSRAPIISQVRDLGLVDSSLPMRIVVGLELRDKADLDDFIAEASDPASPGFQQWLTQDEFNAFYGPTPDQEGRVIDWLAANGWNVTQTFSNRLMVVAEGPAALVENTFGVSVHRVRLEGAEHFAVLQEPLFPRDIAAFTTGVVGLDNLSTPRPMHGVAGRVGPMSNAGGMIGQHFGPPDTRAFYNETSGYTGKGQSVIIAGAYAWADTDLNVWNQQWGLPALPTGSKQICLDTADSRACTSSGIEAIEVALDVQQIHGTAPNATVYNYMAGSPTTQAFEIMFNSVATSSPGAIVSHSWGSCETKDPPSYEVGADNAIASGVAQGQTWFVASGDSGSRMCNKAISVAFPASSPHVTAVGGTTAKCTMTSSDPVCHGYGSETVWSGSGGGKSVTFAKPSWQAGCGVPADGARDIPDVALLADPYRSGVFLVWQGVFTFTGGTSDAAPQWAGNFAALKEKRGGTGLGMAGVRLYQLCGTTAFHDIIRGDNGDYAAIAGYDLATGLGTPDVAKLLAAY